MLVEHTSVFPASVEVVFALLQRPETLSYIARPFATFEPIREVVSTWEVGSTSAYRFRLFGVIPYGTHTIHILCFDPEGVSSRESNEHVPVWNHDIMLKAVDAKHTKYTDRVKIQAELKTVFVWLWANAFYAHRQRKWIKLLREEP